MTMTRTNTRIVKAKLGGNIDKCNKNLTSKEPKVIKKRRIDPFSFNEAYKQFQQTSLEIIKAHIRKEQQIIEMCRPSSELFKQTQRIVEMSRQPLEDFAQRQKLAKTLQPQLELLNQTQKITEMSRSVSKLLEREQRLTEMLRPAFTSFARVQKHAEIFAEQNISTRYNTPLPAISNALLQSPNKPIYQELMDVKEELKEAREELKEVRKTATKTQEVLSAILENRDGSQKPDEPTEH